MRTSLESSEEKDLKSLELSDRFPAILGNREYWRCLVLENCSLWSIEHSWFVFEKENGFEKIHFEDGLFSDSFKNMNENEERIVILFSWERNPRRIMILSNFVLTIDHYTSGMRYFGELWL